MQSKIRMGMIGGGQGAFIGGVHRMAAALDGHIELVCGAFSSDPERSRLSGLELGLHPDRVYSTYEDMIAREGKLPAEVQMNFVSIVTPNHLHFAPAKMALVHGFHVVCDKPLAFDLAQAEELVELVESSGLLFALTHNYTGYPMVKQAREMIARGDLGAIRKVLVDYPQGWLSTRLEATDQKQASWRTDPARSGAAGAIGDIGTHAENLVEYMTGLRINEVCADLTTFVPGRQLDDDGSVLLRFEGGAKGILHASQICVGEENGLNIRIYGERAGLEWHQMEPNTLLAKYPDRSTHIYRTGVGSDLVSAAQRATRLPAGHPEGFLEAFANIYCNFAECLQAMLKGVDANELAHDFPTVHDGLRGMRFIERVVQSSQSDQKWLKM